MISDAAISQEETVSPNFRTSLTNDELEGFLDKASSA
jgi:hypothetical protein